MTKLFTRRFATTAVALFVGLSARQAIAQVPPDAPANVRAIMSKMQRGVPPTKAEAMIVAQYFQSKASAHPGYRPGGGVVKPNWDTIKGIPAVVTVNVNGSFTARQDKVSSKGSWTLNGSFPCRLKVSDQGGREAISPAILAQAKAAAAQMGQKLPDLSKVPKRVPELSSIPLNGSTASYHFVSDPDNEAGAARYCRIDANSSSTGDENSGSMDLRGTFTPNPMVGFDMTLTNFNKGDTLFAFSMLSGGQGITARVHPKPNAHVGMWPGVFDLLPMETAQIADIVKPGSKAVPKPAMKWPVKALQTAVSSGKSTTVSCSEVFNQHMESNDGVADAKGTVTISISLRPKPVELWVEIADYDKWLPEGGIDETVKGNQMKVHAVLKTTDGKLPPAGQLARKITFQLSKVSKEPGTCINWPAAAEATKDPDLKFDSKDPGNVQINDETTAERTEVNGKADAVDSADANIACYDWGAYADLKVTATLPDGRVIEGKIKGQPDSQILIPKRDPSSKIADSWKAISAIDGDDDQDDETSNGNDHKGDGFTLYEEYRGVWAKGKHQYLTPTSRDIVVLNKIGNLVQPGIDLFGKASDCKAITLQSGELDEDTRVVNCNHSSVFGGEQHGLVIVAGDVSKIPTESTLRGESMADGMASVVPPNEIKNRKIKDTKQIMVDMNAWGNQLTVAKADPNYKEADLPALDQQLDFNLRVAVAHEMGHAVGLLHHGKKGGGGPITILPNNHDRAFDEKGKEIAIPTNGLKISSYSPMESPDSGDVDCIMCYTDTDDWARHDGASLGSSDYYKVPKVGFGVQTRFCKSGEGTLFNASDHPPVPMFGDAASGQGSCMSKIVIKDWGSK